LEIQLCYGLVQHLAVTRLGGCLPLLPEALSGKKQALAFPVTLLLVGGDKLTKAALVL